MLWLFLPLIVVFALAAALEQAPLGPGKRHNIVFILTDDQDLHMDSLNYMPLLRKYIINEGTFYKRHYCSTAICCPSRVTMWTGKYAHNTNVTDVFPPYGGYPKFVSQGLNKNYLPIWLQEAGYRTFYTGKLFNAHSILNYDSPFPAGWTSSDFLLDPYTYQYMNATTQRNRDPPVSWEGLYSTDVLAGKAYGLLNDAIASQDPFFLTIATNAPHSNVGTFDPGKGAHRQAVLMTKPIPAERHEHLFADVKVPRKENFNPEKPSGVSWVKDLPRLNSTVIAYNDRFYRARLQALQAVDEIVEGVVTRLYGAGILDNTYVIYSTDNGFHISQHRLPPGKTCGYEEDINIPLIIRGPGVQKGLTTDIVTAHTDLAPTFLKLAGASPRADFDGTAIPLTKSELLKAKKSRQEHVNVEFWGRAVPEGIYGFSVDEGKILTFAQNNTYKALRIISPSYNLYYATHCTGAHELYNLTADPFQLHNIYPPSSATFPTRHPLTRLMHRLDALLLVLKSCEGQSCVEPWKAFHPDDSEEVRTLADAMDVRYDWFYARMHAEGAKVVFRECKAGYLREVEGPDYGSLDLKGLVWGGDGDRVEENGEEEELTFEKY